MARATSKTRGRKKVALRKKKTGLKKLNLARFKTKNLLVYAVVFALIGTVIVIRSFAAPTSPSGQAVPVGNLDGWRQIFVEDFTKDAPVGSWKTDGNAEKVVYTGTNGTQWVTYPEGWNDTYGGKYRPDQVLSVGGGVLNFNLHHVDGYQAGANPSPVVNTARSGSTYQKQNQLYGRYAARFRATNASALKNYYVAWLLWPESGAWNDGEIDFPEGTLSDSVGGFHHCVNNKSGQGTGNCGIVGSTGANFGDWHTYVIEWTPSYVKFILDGKTVLNYTDTKNIPDKPMRWQLQTETKNQGGSSSAQGNLEVDWVSVYAYDPSVKGSVVVPEAPAPTTPQTPTTPTPETPATPAPTTPTTPTPTTAADTTKPSAPTNVQVSNVTKTGATLTWTAATDNVGVTSYDINKDNAYFDYTTGTSYTLKDLSCGKSYAIKVISLDAANNYNDTATVNVKTAACKDETTQTPAPAPQPQTPTTPTAPSEQPIVVSGVVSVIETGTKPAKVEVIASGQAVKVNNKGQVDTRSLSNGVYNVKITTTDKSGKVSTKKLTVEVKNKPLTTWEKITRWLRGQ